jgi:hypothetical protein
VHAGGELMMRIGVIVLMLVAGPGLQPVIGQTVAGTKHTCNPGNLDQEKPSTKKAIEDFWQRFEIALQKNDKSQIAKMVAYPLSVGFPSGGDLEVSSQRQFLKEYTRIFPGDLRDMLLRQRADCIRRVGAKGFSVAAGQIWFDQYPDGEVKIFSMTVVVYPEP